MVFAVTNEKGKTRKQRASYKYYEGIRNCKHATFIKVCDRLANMQYSRVKNKSMYGMYIKELDAFVGELDIPNDMEMALYNILTNEPG